MQTADADFSTCQPGSDLEKPKYVAVPCIQHAGSKLITKMQLDTLHMQPPCNHSMVANENNGCDKRIQLTCSVDHVNEAKEEEECSGQEKVGLPNHEHNQVHQQRGPKEHAAHCHT